MRKKQHLFGVSRYLAWKSILLSFSNITSNTASRQDPADAQTQQYTLQWLCLPSFALPKMQELCQAYYIMPDSRFFSVKHCDGIPVSTNSVHPATRSTTTGQRESACRSCSCNEASTQGNLATINQLRGGTHTVAARLLYDPGRRL